MLAAAGIGRWYTTRALAAMMECSIGDIHNGFEEIRRGPYKINKRGPANRNEYQIESLE